ncbi:MAG: hypothetical protein DME03_18100 [Candidatus Rokuibacteriota bacterium]|nr:MAG: hypothetical protein DME03_18100 [Candidatus Rokubacteria bacterium]
MYVIDALRKVPYRDTDGTYIWHPPSPKSQAREVPIRSDPRGQFDHVTPGTRPFSAAAVYATVRCVLEIWEYYLGRRLPLVLKGRQTRLEIVPRVTAVGDNAWSGEGFFEFGFGGRDPRQPNCENFDIVAHEVGHLILRRVIGTARKGPLEFERRSHDEAGADLISLVSILHLDRVRTAVLEETRGKLFSVNILSRIGEYRLGRAGRHAGRLLLQNKTMRSVRGLLRRKIDKFGYAKPLLGAAFDILIEIYEARLVQRELILPELAKRSTAATARGHPGIRREFAKRYRANPDGFDEALRDATADFARILALAWRKARHSGVTFSKVASHMVTADLQLNRGLYGPIIRRAFARRRIAVRVRRR